jgi:hypothetical protein
VAGETTGDTANKIDESALFAGFMTLLKKNPGLPGFFYALFLKILRSSLTWRKLVKFLRAILFREGISGRLYAAIAG